MTLKIHEVLALQKLYNKLSKQELPIRLNYKLTKLYKNIESDFEFYRTRMTEIINIYGLKDDNGQFILTDNGAEVKIQPDKVNECQDKINELMNLETSELPILKLKLDELGNISLTMQEMSILEQFIEE